MIWLQSCSSVAPIAELCSLAMVFAAASALSRSTGSAICVCSLANMPETWFRAGRSEGSCTDTGTNATREDFGNSPRSSRNWRTTPPTRAITTSLTLTPKWFLTFLTSSRSSRAKATLRSRGETAVEHGPRGGERSRHRAAGRRAPDGVDHRSDGRGQQSEPGTAAGSRTGPDRRSRSAAGWWPPQPRPGPVAAGRVRCCTAAKGCWQRSHRRPWRGGP